MNKPKGIYGFFGEFRYLSNFYLTPTKYENLIFPSSEQAYQAAKTLDQKTRLRIQACSSPFESKKLGYSVVLRKNWDQIKYDIMFNIVLDKFSRNIDIQEKLINTSGLYLEETNTWGDTYWGVCKEKGENNLGKILMNVRGILQNKK